MDTRKAERRARLMDAGLELFGTQGFHATTIATICAQAKVTPRHFYEQFDSREALLATVYRDVYEDAMTKVRSAFLTGDTHPARIHAALSAFYAAYLEDPRRGRVACVESVGVSAELAEQRHTVIHGFAALVESYVTLLAQESGLPQRSYHLVCVGLIGAINELVCDWLYQAERVPIDALVTETELLIGALVEGAHHWPAD